MLASGSATDPGSDPPDPAPHVNEKSSTRSADGSKSSRGRRPEDDDDDDAEEQAAEELLEEEEAEDQDRDEDPPGVTGYLRRLLRRKSGRTSIGDETEHETNVLDPLAAVDSRYLPIISGLTCPFSVLLEIPGLTEPWYVRTDGNVVVESRPNPIPLDVGLAISLALGVAANCALVARFLEFRPKRFTLLAIAALTVHDLINIGAVTWFGVSRRHADGFNYGDTFWETVASTVASTVCNITLTLDLVRTRDFVRRGSGLTERQRALMITVMLLFLYLGLGALAYFYLIPDLRVIDALFFSEVTIFTVGFGDPVPRTAGAKTFTCFYASFGIILFALTVATTRDTILETFELSYRSRRARLAQKARERKELHLNRARRLAERRRRQSEVLLNGSGDGAGVASLNEKVDDGATRTVETRLVHEKPVAATSRKTPKSRTWLNRLQRKKAHGSSDETEAGDRTLTVTDGGAALDRRNSTLSLASAQSVDVSFRSLREQLAREEQQEFRTKLSVSVFFFLIFWLGGAAVFVPCENWTYGTAIWFAFETFSTIGYGDFIPYSAAGRAFFIPWSIVGIGNMTLLFSVLSEAWSSRYKSSLQTGRMRRLVRRRMLFIKEGVKPRSEKQADRDTLARLLDTEGYQSVSREPVPPEELPGKIVETIRSFHAHARYFMLGRTGEPPQQLRVLLDAADSVDTQLDTLLLAKTSALVGSAAGRDTKEYLFMLSYEREFDRVVESANQLSTAIQNAGQELAALNAENDRLQAELRQLRLDTGTPDPNAGDVDVDGEVPPQPISRTPTLTFASSVPASTSGKKKTRRNSLAVRRTHSVPYTNTGESTTSTAPSSTLGARAGAAVRKHLS